MYYAQGSLDSGIGVWKLTDGDVARRMPRDFLDLASEPQGLATIHRLNLRLYPKVARIKELRPKAVSALQWRRTLVIYLQGYCDSHFSISGGRDPRVAQLV